MESCCALCHSDDADAECMLCKAPHHSECWKYNDSKCSVYGCQSCHSTNELADFQKVYRRGLTNRTDREGFGPIIAAIAALLFLVGVMELPNDQVGHAIDDFAGPVHVYRNADTPSLRLPISLRADYGIFFDGNNLEKIPIDETSYLNRLGFAYGLPAFQYEEECDDCTISDDEEDSIRVILDQRKNF